MTKEYDQPCPLARTMDIIGERWTILILRELFLNGPRRYQDLENGLSGISPNTLATRLKKLELNGVITREIYDQRPLRAQYELTEKGEALRPALAALRDWGREQLPPIKVKAR